MPRTLFPSPISYDSDASYSPDDDDASSDLFDHDEADKSDPETAATDVDELRSRSEDCNSDVDTEDQAQLFEGNAYPPEYYRQAVEHFNVSAYETQDYSDGSKLLQDACKENWNQYVYATYQFWTSANNSLLKVLCNATA